MKICIIAVLVKASWMQCPLHNQNVNKLSSHGAPCQLAPFHSQTILNAHCTILTNSSVMVGRKCSLWGMKMMKMTRPKMTPPPPPPPPPPTHPHTHTHKKKVLIVAVVVGCVQGSKSQVSTFSCYSHCPLLTQNASKGYENNFKNLCYNTDSVCFAKTVSPAQYSYGSRDPTTRVLGFTSYLGLGTRDPYLYWGRWHSMATHT